MDFETEFTGVDGAGFFPGAGGYFHGCDGAPREPRIVFMGSDFGAFKKWSETVKPAGEEDPERQTTLKAVRELVDEVARQTDVAADILRSRCYLTNAVLALAKVGGNMQTSKVYRNPDHRDYLRECGEEYRRWFGEPERGRSLVVLLGDVHVKLYGCRIWSRVWPDLFGPDGLWCCAEFPDILGDRGAIVREADSGQHVVIMRHPSSGTHWENHRRNAARALAVEVGS